MSTLYGLLSDLYASPLQYTSTERLKTESPLQGSQELGQPLNFVARLDHRSWEGMWGLSPQRTRQRYALSLHRRLLNAYRRLDPTLDLSLSAQVSSDMGMSALSLAHLRGVSQVELWLPRASLSLALPRQRLTLTAGRLVTVGTHRMLPLDGLEVGWRGGYALRDVAPLVLRVFLGYTPQLGYNGLIGGRWGALPLRMPPPLQGVRWGAGLKARAQHEWGEYALEVMGDQRWSDDQSAEERVGWSVTGTASKFQLTQGGQFDPLTQQWGSLWASLGWFERAYALALEVRSIKQLWPLDSIWWVFLQRPEHRVSVQLMRKMNIIELRSTPYYFSFSEPLAPSMDSETKVASGPNRDLEAPSSIGERGAGIETLLSWRELAKSPWSLELNLDIALSQVSGQLSLRRVDGELRLSRPGRSYDLYGHINLRRDQASRGPLSILKRGGQDGDTSIEKSGHSLYSTRAVTSASARMSVETHWLSGAKIRLTIDYLHLGEEMRGVSGFLFLNLL